MNMKMCLFLQKDSLRVSMLERFVITMLLETSSPIVILSLHLNPSTRLLSWGTILIKRNDLLFTWAMTIMVKAITTGEMPSVQVTEGFVPSLDTGLMIALPKLTLLMTHSWKRLLLIAGLCQKKSVI
jgi:hypothetical protein